MIHFFESKGRVDLLMSGRLLRTPRKSRVANQRVRGSAQPENRRASQETSGLGPWSRARTWPPRRSSPGTRGVEDSAAVRAHRSLGASTPLRSLPLAWEGLAARALAPAAPLRPEHRAQLALLAALGLELDTCPVGARAEVAAVDDEALLAALHGEYGFGERRVGGIFEARPEAAFDRVDAGRDLDVDEPVQVEDHVGQVVARGAQVDGALERLCEDRGEDGGGAVDRAFGAALGGELH